LSWLSDDTLTEIHTQSDSGERRAWTLEMDRSALTLAFRDSQSTHAAPFEKATAQSTAGQVTVRSGQDPHGAGNDTLLYTSGSLEDARIRYQQLAFADVQSVNSGELLQSDAMVFNLASGGLEEAQSWRSDGWWVRLYGFAKSDVDLSKYQPNCPATDSPESTWYQDYLVAVDALK
jgi:hypothetical protein